MSEELRTICFFALWSTTLVVFLLRLWTATRTAEGAERLHAGWPVVITLATSLSMWLSPTAVWTDEGGWLHTGHSWLWYAAITAGGAALALYALLTTNHQPADGTRMTHHRRRICLLLPVVIPAITWLRSSEGYFVLQLMLSTPDDQIYFAATERIDFYEHRIIFRINNHWSLEVDTDDSHFTQEVRDRIVEYALLHEIDFPGHESRPADTEEWSTRLNMDWPLEIPEANREILNRLSRALNECLLRFHNVTIHEITQRSTSVRLERPEADYVVSVRHDGTEVREAFISTVTNKGGNSRIITAFCVDAAEIPATMVGRSEEWIELRHSPEGMQTISRLIRREIDTYAPLRGVRLQLKEPEVVRISFRR